MSAPNQSEGQIVNLVRAGVRGEEEILKAWWGEVSNEHGERRELLRSIYAARRSAELRVKGSAIDDRE